MAEKAKHRRIRIETNKNQRQEINA